MSGFEERARARAHWPVTMSSLGEEALARGPDDPSAAWHAVLELSREAYAAMGVSTEPLPRAQWPARLYRPGEVRPDSNGL